MIGEVLEDSDEVCGVVISPRKGQNKLALWTKTAKNKVVTMRVGAAFKQQLQLTTPIGYQVQMKRAVLLSSRVAA